MSSTHASNPRLIEHTTPLVISRDAMIIGALNAETCAHDTEIAAPRLSGQTGQDKLGEAKLGWEKVIHSQAQVIREQAGRIRDLEEGAAGKDAELENTAMELEESQEDALYVAEGYQEAMSRVAVLAAENQALKGKLKDSESRSQLEKMQRSIDARKVKMSEIAEMEEYDLLEDFVGPKIQISARYPF